METLNLVLDVDKKELAVTSQGITFVMTDTGLNYLFTQQVLSGFPTTRMVVTSINKTKAAPQLAASALLNLLTQAIIEWEGGEWHVRNFDRQTDADLESKPGNAENT